MPTPTITQLKEAIAIAEQIEKLQAQLASIVGGSGVAAPVAAASTEAPVAKKGKRYLSPEARGRIAAAQKARWSKVKGTAAVSAPAPASVKTSEPIVKKGKKRKLSPEGRAKIVAALKARWAKNKAA